MSEEVIQVEELSKMYRLGDIGSGTLSHDLGAWWKRKLGRTDSESLTKMHETANVKKYIWSLKEINFNVREGEIFGIIGRNGAGKSTLLKLLSKISKPSSGRIHINGRIASLLEVGTGFHPDLSGRENVFLNGAILGMSRAEIKSKFDEIVQFSGVERFIDTPVKRYSSGMYVRLAFAVAAHLEPEILIIDEVLAVGDAEFQRKCLGKIKDVSNKQGRTVLFVTHNLNAIKQLCNRVLLLEQGTQKAVGPVGEVLHIYEEKYADQHGGLRGEPPENTPGYFVEWQVDCGRHNINPHSCYSRDNCSFLFRFRAHHYMNSCELRFMLFNEAGIIVNTSSLSDKGNMFPVTAGEYIFRLQMQLPVHFGNYRIELAFINLGQVVDLWNSSTPLSVLNNYENHIEGAMLNIRTSFSVEPVYAGIKNALEH